jgi:uncharacterized membrane protein YraQ (UPF0718 family)
MDFPNEIKILTYLTLYQFKLIFPYWIIGLIAGSVISVFAFDKIKSFISAIGKKTNTYVGILIAVLLGAVSPVCMYGTIPLIASLGRRGVPQHVLAAFMVSSILINPNLFIFSFALGFPVALTRLLVCLAAGFAAGALVRLLFKNKKLFNFEGFGVSQKCNSGKSSLLTYVSDLHRGIVKTAPYFFTGIILTALFDRYVPSSLITSVFGGNQKFGIFLAASLGIPVYVCGGGTIPLLKEWLEQGMSIGSAVAFMLSGPATKLTNLSAVKTILGIRNFIIYIAFNVIFAVAAGFITDIVFNILGIIKIL